MDKLNGKRKNRRMFTLEELRYAAQILNFFAPEPRCICGSREFKVGIFQNELNAFCYKCGKHYVYNERDRKWGTKPVYFNISYDNSLFIEE